MMRSFDIEGMVRQARRERLEARRAQQAQAAPPRRDDTEEAGPDRAVWSALFEGMY